jgi:hypothetical protein
MAGLLERLLYDRRRVAIIVVIAYVVLVVVTVSLLPNREPAAPKAAEAPKQDEICPAGTKWSGLSLKARAGGINIRKGPSPEFDRIVDQKATNAARIRKYASVNAGNTVFEECRGAEWSRVRVTSPEALRNSHYGWVSNKFLVDETAAPPEGPLRASSLETTPIRSASAPTAAR